MNCEENRRVKKSARINVFDVALLVLLAFAVLAFFHKSQLVDTFDKDRVSRSYTVAFEISGVRYDVIDDLALGTVAYTQMGEQRVVLGSLVDEPLITAHTVAVPESGATVDLAGTLLCHGILREGALVLPDGYVLRAGDTLSLSTEVTTVAVYVISITEIG